jgi:hypothetical protein
MSEELSMEELRWLVDHKEEIIHKLNLKNDAIQAKLDDAVEALKLANMRLRVNKPNRLEDYVITQGITETLERLEQK